MNAVGKKKIKKRGNFALALIFLRWLKSILQLLVENLGGGDRRVPLLILSFSICTVLKIVNTLHISLLTSLPPSLSLPPRSWFPHLFIYLFIYLLAVLYVSHSACPRYSGMRRRDGLWPREESLCWLSYL